MIALVLALCAGCEGSSPSRGAREPGPSRTHETASSRPEPRRRWELADRVATLAVVGEIAQSHHLDGKRKATLVTSVPGVYPARSGPMPEGAIIAESLRPSDDAEPVLFAMVKRAPGWFPEGGDWAYAVVLADGMVESEGRLETCARCHAEAPRDHLFGNPRPP